MGVVANVGYNTFPKQGRMLGKSVNVIFNFDVNNQLDGKIVRNDAEAPWQTIILLDNGRAILGAECQFQPKD